MEIALIEPQIPPNTGNIARLCAATRTPLHLVRPLGFHLTDRHLKRAGLDYWKWVDLRVHDSLKEFLHAVRHLRLFFFSKKATLSYLEICFDPNDCLVFGSETKGLPAGLFRTHPDRFHHIPMLNRKVRSLNLSTAVAIVTYEALRQTKFSQNQSV